MSTSDPTAAERQCRYRARLREGSKFMRSDLSPENVEWLKENGWIDEAGADDPDKLGDAASDVLDCVRRGTLAPRRTRGVTP